MSELEGPSCHGMLEGLRHPEHKGREVGQCLSSTSPEKRGGVDLSGGLSAPELLLVFHSSFSLLSPTRLYGEPSNCTARATSGSMDPPLDAEMVPQFPQLESRSNADAQHKVMMLFVLLLLLLG